MQPPESMNNSIQKSSEISFIETPSNPNKRLKYEIRSTQGNNQVQYLLERMRDTLNKDDLYIVTAKDSIQSSIESSLDTPRLEDAV